MTTSQGSVSLTTAQVARGWRSLVTVPAAAIAILGLGTLVFVASGLPFAVYSPPLDIALLAVASVVAVSVAALSYARYREEAVPEALVASAAFVVLATANSLHMTAILTGADAVLGFGASNPGQLPLYFWGAARLLAAGLLAAGAFPRTARLVTDPRRPLVVAWTPAVALVLVGLALVLLRDQLPALVPAAALRVIALGASTRAPLPVTELPLLVLDGSTAVLLLVAARGYARTQRGFGAVPRPLLVLGLLLAAFSQVHFLLYPGVYSGAVSTGDLLRLGFYAALLVGIHAGARADVQALRGLNARLRLFAAAEADRTAIAERARMARELHDGLAQDVWTAQLEFDRLVHRLQDADEPTREQVERVREALDATAREARSAMNALRSGFDAGLSLPDELPRRLDEFADRTGYPVELQLDPRAREVAGTVAADVIRIVEEALHNVQKHADATRIGVAVTVEGNMLVVAIKDNGRGFTPTAATAGRGLVGMRERAAALGGWLEVRSSPGEGTAIRLHLPIEGVRS